VRGARHPGPEAAAEASPTSLEAADEAPGMTWPNDVRRPDLRVEFIRGSGRGGQNKNKRDTACRITHLPTGISARAEDQRSQDQNKRSAFRRLAGKLTPLMRAAARRAVVAISTTRVRTYHFPRGVVIDHPTGYIYPVGRTLDGDLDPIHRDRARAGAESS
jgi:peptide chain release factor 1